jgi:uncharacterized protein (TIGR02246 family)
MRRYILGALLLFAFGSVACDRDEADFQPEEIIALERAALDRWGKGDPQGYLETYAADITYFDPLQDRRIDGLEAMKGLLEPYTGKISVARFDMIAPKVQRFGNAAVLTSNLISYVRKPDGTETIAARWNSTEVYGRVDGRWRIVHSHWSYIKPELKQPTFEGS